MKNFWKDNRRFADLFNAALFDIGLLQQSRWLQTMGSSHWQTITAGFAVLENAAQYDKIYQGRERQNICEKERTANGKKDAVWND